jgi:hypothetical protein
MKGGNNYAILVKINDKKVIKQYLLYYCHFIILQMEELSCL